MSSLVNISSKGKWSNSVNNLNSNFVALGSDITSIEGDVQKCKGLFPSESELISMYPTAQIGSWAYVGDSLPATIYVHQDRGWVETGNMGGGSLDPSSYANSDVLNGGADSLYSMSMTWIVSWTGQTWNPVNNGKIPVISGVTQYIIRPRSLKFGEDGELLKMSTYDQYQAIFNKGSFVSMNLTSSSGISKNYTTGSLSWTIDDTFYTRKIGDEVQNRLPVVGDELRAALYFKSPGDDDTKVIVTVFKFSNS